MISFVTNLLQANKNGVYLRLYWTVFIAIQVSVYWKLILWKISYYSTDIFIIIQVTAKHRSEFKMNQW